MPHRCIECKSVLEAGEMDVDTGCPVCGGKKFQYIRPQKKEPKEPVLKKLTVAEYVAHAEAVEPKPVEKHKRKEAPKAEAKAVEAKAVPEPALKEKKPAHGIESVRIVEKGNYDINLPMLLNRKELVMSKEDGVYVVDLPSALKVTPKKKKKR